MRTIIAIAVAAGIGFMAAYAIVSSNTNAQLKQERAVFEAEKARLESALAEAQQKSGRVRTVELPGSTPASSKLTPQEILDRLLQIHPGSGTNRTRAIRLVVYYLESLAECGQPALPVIAQFFERNEDVDYSIEDDGGSQQGGRGNFFAFRRGQQLRTDFVLPPSLRLGLVDVVSQIGGEQAEKIMASVLSTTGRGVEVAYLARKLESIAPGKYRDLALSVAKDLLSNPIPVNNPDRLDQNARGYLYSVLEMYNDTSFVATAQSQLIGPDGRVDRDALDYLTRTLKDQSVAALYAAYKDTRLTNFNEKAQLASQMLNYTGQNPQADTLFKEIVSDTNVNNGARMFAIMQLAGGGGAGGGGRGGGGAFGGMESPTDAKVIAARMQLLESVASTVTDERMTQVLLTTGQNLQNLLEGKPVEFQNAFGGGRGQRGQRGPGAGGPPGGF